MSLVRLLTSGKSLVGLTEPPHRYRMRSKNPLPKLSNNPFSERPVSTGTKTAAEIEAENLKETRRLPDIVIPEPLTPNARMRTRWTAAREFIGRLAQKLVPWRMKPAPKAVLPIAKPEKVAVQGELSLDNIKVVRNDLSESDVELAPVQPAKPATKPILRNLDKPMPSGTGLGGVVARALDRSITG